MKRPPRTYCGPLLFVLVMTCPPIAMAQTIWVEGERPARSTMNRHPWWYDQVKKDQLSGGDWISNFSEEKEGEAEYRFDVPKAARYAFWIRANPVQAQLDYFLDKAPGKPIDMSTDVLDTVNLAADGKPDLRFLGWKKVGEFPLSAGPHTVRFRFYSKPQHHGALDAFVFTTEPFCPAVRRSQGRGAGSRRPREPGLSCPSAISFVPMLCSICAGSMKKSPARADS